MLSLEIGGKEQKGMKERKRVIGTEREGQAHRPSEIERKKKLFRGTHKVA